MQLSHRLWLASVAVLFGLAVALVPAHALEPKLLPADTEVVVSINFKQILKSDVAKANKELVDLAKGFIDQKLAEKNVGQYFEQAGFDLFRDLSSVTVAGPGTKDPEAGFIIIEGKFNTDKVHQVLEEVTKKSGDVKAVKIGDVNAFEITPKGEKTVYAGIIGTDKLLATGSKDAFAEAIARLGGNRPSKLKKEIASLLDTAGTKQSFSLVATGPAIARMLENAPIPNAEQAMAGLAKLDGLSLGVTVEKNVTFELGISAKDKATAEEVAKASNAGVMLARTFVKQKATDDPKAAAALEVVNTLRVTSQANNVLIRGEITMETLGKILENLPMQK